MESLTLFDVVVLLGMFFLRIGLPLLVLMALGSWLQKRAEERAVVTNEALSPRILVVDDDPDFVNLTQTILHSRNYEVMTAADGQQAMQVMRENKPDLTLLDIMMTHLLEGLEVSREMAKDPTLKDVPVIMVSSLARNRARTVLPSNEHIPMEKWIQKPIDPDLLLAEVESALGHTRAPAMA